MEKKVVEWSEQKQAGRQAGVGGEAKGLARQEGRVLERIFLEERLKSQILLIDGSIDRIAGKKPKKYRFLVGREHAAAGVPVIYF